MFSIGQKTCIKLIEEGYVHTFEEIHNLINNYGKVKEEAERGTSKVKPKDFSKESKILRHLEENLKNAEETVRKGSVFKSFSYFFKRFQSRTFIF